MNRPRQFAATLLPLFVLAAGCHYQVIVHDRIDRRAAVETARRVSRIRQLRYVDKVHLALVDRQQVVRQASRDSSARRESARARGERRLYEMLGLIAAGDDPQTARQQIGDFQWSVCAAGRTQFAMTTHALLMGGHARVGLEDNLYLEKGVLAKSSGEQVAKLKRIAGELGVETAIPAEARQILGLKGLDRVAY